MITRELTNQDIADMKRIFEEYRFSLTPCRKTGAEVDSYFRSRYSFEPFDNSDFIKMVEAGISENGFLPEGARPDIKSYRMDDILVGIDLSSGEFHVEAEDIDKVIPVYDDLFVYRGLGKDDLDNFVLVAEYVRLAKTAPNK